MSEKLLYFNGVNGSTGEYGVESQTVEAFYNHVVNPNELAYENKVETIERLIELKRQPGVWRLFETIITITKQCIQENIDDDDQLTADATITDLSIQKDAGNDRYDLWLGRLAEGIVEQILGKTGEVDAIWQLKERMRLDVSYILRLILEKLMKNDRLTSHDLAVLLSEPDDQDIRKEKLKHEALDKILAIRDTLFSEESLQKAKSTQEAAHSWINTFIAELRTLPIKPLKAIGYVTKDDKLQYSFTRLSTLAEKLDDLHNPALDPLIEQLDQFYSNSWDKLLTMLSDGLLALPDNVYNAEMFGALEEWLKALRRIISHLGTIEGVDPTDISQAGWGIIFPAVFSREKVNRIKNELGVLLNFRKNQTRGLYQEYTGDAGYRPDDTAARFIARKGARVTDPVDPIKVPYYLLIIGSPEEIPFHFQYQLDVQYAVGRIDFGEDWEAYAAYARKVVAAEKGEIDQTEQAVFFGVANPGDKATQTSADHLVEPLFDKFQHKTSQNEVLSGWHITPLLRNQATRENLLKLIAEQTPAFLFTASHGLEFSLDDFERQRQRQGALLCQDWKGEFGEIPDDYYVKGDDIHPESDLSGLIAFFFACYGAGTPRYDEYAKQGRERKAITRKAFIAALPQAMLKQGALAVIGHVERAWATSFLDRRSEYVTVFESTIERLLKGYPVGWAMEYFNTRYAALSSELTMALSIPASRSNTSEISEAWIANNDARGYIVIGDPAVHLPVLKEGPQTKTYVIHGEKEMLLWD